MTMEQYPEGWHECMEKLKEKRFAMLTKINALESKLRKDQESELRKDQNGKTIPKMTYTEKQKNIADLKKLLGELSASLRATSNDCLGELSASLRATSNDCLKEKIGSTMVDAVLEAYINKKRWGQVRSAGGRQS
jgi:hypothetical protein